MNPDDWRANVRRVIAWKALSNLIFFAGVLVPFFTQWGGLSLRQVFLLQAWFMLWVVAFELPTGAFADRFGRRASLIAATLCYIGAVAYYITHRGFPHFLVAEFAWAGASAFSSGADEAVVYDSLKAAGAESRSKVELTRLGTAEILPLAAAAPIGSWAGAHWGLPAALGLCLIPFSLALPVALALREPAHDPQGPRPGYWTVLTGGARYFAAHPALRALAFDAISIRCLSVMLIWLYQPRLQELGLGLVWLGWVMAGITLFQSALLLRIETAERWFGGPRRYLVWSAVIAGAAYLGLAAAANAWLASLLIILVTGFGLSRSVVIGNYMQRHIPAAQRATVLSAVGMARQLAIAALYPVVGWAAEKSLTWTFAGLGAAALACAAASWVEEKDL